MRLYAEQLAFEAFFYFAHVDNVLKACNFNIIQKSLKLFTLGY